MIHLSPKLTYSNLDETVVLKHFTRLARDEQGGIRTNTTVCLGKIARYLHPKTRQQVLLACFTRGLKDPFPPSRIAAINAIAATQHFYTVAETGCRVLPILGAVTAKFYKSPAAPASNESTPAPEESGGKAKTPDRSRSSTSPDKDITSSVRKMEMNDSFSSSGKKSTPAKSESGWDIQEDDG